MDEKEIVEALNRIFDENPDKVEEVDAELFKLAEELTQEVLCSK